ncbi:MAG: tetratricopeptide repeat protein [Bdellovibrionales bacterium]|nr:tetratricopeptide repeat protein [Bdellovibrionales bacterium]
MKKIISSLLLFSLVFVTPVEGARKQSSKTNSRAKTTRSSGNSELKEAMALAKKGEYQAASAKFFILSVSPKYINNRMQIRYLLGLMLYQLKMYQLAAFQFISVIRGGNNRYIPQALEKLSLAANELGDDTLLNYAISRVKTESFPAVHRDMLFYRIGEFQYRNAQYNDAIRSFSQVPDKSSLYDKALYMKGLSYAQSGNPDKAVLTFDMLIDQMKDAPITDSSKVAGQLGKARALYQKKSWDDSIQAYRDVPRDSSMWHDTIFESSWAMLRSGRFRSAISNFQSLHSPYYEESYIPESLLLRSIVYLYICKYDEMDKVLNLFNKIYKPVYKNVTEYLKSSKNSVQYFNDVILTMQAAEKPGFDPSSSKFVVPYLITQKISKEGDFQRSFQYIKKLIAERNRVRRMPASWRNSGIGKYALKTLDTRILKARAKAGRQIRAHMISVRTELIDLFEQEGFIRYEMINGKKEQLKKRVAGKELPKAQIDESSSRDYYIQNGYEYWPFRGEYWLDEIGNYHYLGAQSCE